MEFTSGNTEDTASPLDVKREESDIASVVEATTSLFWEGDERTTTDDSDPRGFASAALDVASEETRMLSGVPDVSEREPVRVGTMEGVLVELAKGTEK